MIGVRATASITASRRPGAGRRASTTCHLRFGDERECDVVGELGRHVDFAARNVGISGALQVGGRGARIGDALTRAHARQRLEARRIRRIGVMSEIAGSLTAR